MSAEFTPPAPQPIELDQVNEMHGQAANFIDNTASTLAGKGKSQRFELNGGLIDVSESDISRDETVGFKREVTLATGENEWTRDNRHFAGLSDRKYLDAHVDSTQHTDYDEETVGVVSGTSAGLRKEHAHGRPHKQWVANVSTRTHPDRKGQHHTTSRVEVSYQTTGPDGKPKTVELNDKWALYAAKKILAGAQDRIQPYTDEVAQRRDARNERRRNKRRAA